MKGPSLLEHYDFILGYLDPLGFKRLKPLFNSPGLI